MPHLLLISIGPVQEFIASARRTRDLWFGSWMLSELGRAAVQSLCDTPHGTTTQLIFPAPTTRGELDNSTIAIPNKLLVRIDVEPRMAALHAKTAAMARLHALRDQPRLKAIWDRIPDQRSTAMLQIDDLVEWMWAAVPFNGSYREAHAQVEALLASRKNTRTFHPPEWASAGVPKSSIDGLREAVIPESLYPPPRATPAARRHAAAELFRLFGAGQGERLSAVDLLKRHGRPENELMSRDEEVSTFPSTSHLAARPLMAWMKHHAGEASEALRRAWTSYLEELPLAAQRERYIPARFTDPIFGRIDGALLFEERLAESFVDQADQRQLLAVRGALTQFLHAYANGICPRPYIAIIHADGDQMGKWINALAGWAEDNRSITAMAAHQQLSQALAQFARNVPMIVETTHHGALVYAGGDDVLALLPLHTALRCAASLAHAFHSTMATCLAEMGGEGHLQLPTLSVGMAIVHHLEPLSDGLALAREAEQKAKRGGRNALAITLSKRGGVDRTLLGQWGADGTPGVFVDHLMALIALHQRQAIPQGLAYELHTLERQLAHLPRQARQIEARRILLRKRSQFGTRRLSDDAASGVTGTAATGSTLERLNALFDDYPTLSDVAEALIISEIFAEAEALATGQNMPEETPHEID